MPESIWRSLPAVLVSGDHAMKPATIDVRPRIARWSPIRRRTQTAKIDSEKEEWTGTWRDSRIFNPLGPKPENAVTGTLHTVGGFRNDRLAVPAQYGRLRFWRNTEVSTQKEGETALLGKGVLGHELDEDVDNGFRPAGLIRLSETTIPNVAYLQDLGTVYDAGTATHHLTLYRAPNGALVFSAGSAQYSWGLDNYHTNWSSGGDRVRPEIAGPVKALQQATVNLLADMGVQPANLQSELAPAQPSQDKSQPLSKIAFPSDGALVQGIVTIRGTAMDAHGAVAGVEVSVDGGVNWHPAVGNAVWSYDWHVPENLERATILSRAIDDIPTLRPSPSASACADTGHVRPSLHPSRP